MFQQNNYSIYAKGNDKSKMKSIYQWKITFLTVIVLV